MFRRMYEDTANAWLCHSSGFFGCLLRASCGGGTPEMRGANAIPCRHLPGCWRRANRHRTCIDVRDSHTSTLGCQFFFGGPFKRAAVGVGWCALSIPVPGWECTVPAIV